MFQDFKPVFLVLLRFIVIYLALLFAYQFYLNSFDGKEIDLFSMKIAEQVQSILNFLNYPTELYHQKEYETVWFYTKSKYVSRMVEGCNAISVMILFLAFVFAFYKGLKTFVFAAIGLVFLYVMNVLRIVGINVLISDHPEYQKIAHDYLFPAIIYGSVVLLWLIWIKFFALKNTKTENL